MTPIELPRSANSNRALFRAVAGSWTPKKTRRIRVMGWPAFSTAQGNPYNYRLYTALTALGVEVSEYTAYKLFTGRYDIIHIHWPEGVCGERSSVKALLRLLFLYFKLGMATVKGARIVWTAHNIRPHESRHPWCNRWLFWGFPRFLSGVISLSRSALDAVQGAMRIPSAIPRFVIPHGHYRDDYPSDVQPGPARRILKFSEEHIVVGFIGNIRQYKNVPALIAAFRQLSGDGFRLLISGEPFGEAERRSVEAAAGDDPRITMQLRHVPGDELQSCFRACNLIVLPFRDILNSGSAILALSFGCPVLVPAIGAMKDLRDVAGSDWVMTFEGELTAATLAAAVRWARDLSRPPLPDLDALEWPEIARQTLDAYCSILDHASSR